MKDYLVFKIMAMKRKYFWDAIQKIIYEQKTWFFRSPNDPRYKNSKTMEINDW